MNQPQGPKNAAAPKRIAHNPAATSQYLAPNTRLRIAGLALAGLACRLGT